MSITPSPMYGPPGSAKADAKSSRAFLSGTFSFSDVFQIETEKPTEPRSSWQIKLEQYLRSNVIQIPLGCCSIYTLFFDSLRIASFPKSADTVFMVLMSIVVGCFVVEMVVSLLCKRDYFPSFFFVLEVLCILSSAYDIFTIAADFDRPMGIDYLYPLRLVRVLPVFRIVRAIKLWCLTRRYRERNKRKQQERVQAAEKQLEVAPKVPQGMLQRKRQVSSKDLRVVHTTGQVENLETHVATQSQTSRTLEGIKLRLMFVFIICVGIAMSVFSFDYFIATPSSLKYNVVALDQGHSVLSAGDFKALCESVQSYERHNEYPLVSLRGPDCNFDHPETKVSDLRAFEKLLVKSGAYSAVADKRSYTQLSAGLRMCKVLFLCLLLVLFSLFAFYYSTQTVLVPIELMMEKLQVLRKNPMAFLSLDKEQLGAYHLQASENQRKDLLTQDMVFLENSLNRIANMLGVVYGEAGSIMITKNTSANNVLTPIIAGTKIYSVFGFAKIVPYEEITSVLQEEILVFTNTLAEVIHSTIEKYLGATNKNLGESFFVMWKFKSDDVAETEEGLITKTFAAAILADLALLAYLKIIAKLNKLVHILDMFDNIAQHLGHERVRMIFGLHMGWGIEGPIGSVHKVDASYLSPNVNIAARVESASDIYHVPLLITGQVYNNLSMTGRMFCREIDTVTLKGSNLPIKIYTVDLDVSGLTRKECKYALVNPATRRTKRKFHHHVGEELLKSEQRTLDSLWKSDKDLVAMRKGINQEFLSKFEEGYTQYIERNWQTASKLLQEASALNPQDFPTISLLNYMRTYNNQAPENWAYRPLLEK